MNCNYIKGPKFEHWGIPNVGTNSNEVPNTKIQSWLILSNALLKSI